MRTIRDDDGHQWDVTVGKESYGLRVLLFAPREGGEVRKGALIATSQLAAAIELFELSEEELRLRLAKAELWS